MTLSVIIIAKNAEHQIADAIESVQGISDEVVVVDGGSTDRTVDIAKYLKASVHIIKTSDFSIMRNEGFKKAQGDWVLYIDSDERTTELLRKNIESGIRNEESGIVAYKIRRKNFYFGEHEWPYIEKLERLFKKEKLKGWRGQLHESPVFEGEISELEGFLLHYTHRDLASMLAKTIEWSKIEAELRLKAGHPRMVWWRFPRVMISAFLDSYIKQGGWKAGTAGLIESIYQAFSMFITYARLWEMQQKLRVKNEK